MFEGKKGSCKVVFDDGSEYDGEIENGKRHGTGKFTYVNGDVYEGGWKVDKWDGEGKLVFSFGYVYEGEFKDDKLHGHGKETFSSNSYEGQFENVKHGTGTFRYSSGDVYEGDWKENKRHGIGKCSYHNGNVYAGQWKESTKHGTGKMTYANGDVYNGDWENDKRHGSGTMTYNDNSVYDGDWEGGEKHGTGILKEDDTVIYKQVYNKGEQVGDNKRCGRLMYGPPSQRPRTNETSDITILNDDYKVCFLCRDDFSTDINSTDDDIKNHLPVLSTCCDDFYCLGCIMKMQMARAEANRGRVPKKIACPGCRKKGAFCPSELKYHKLLIKLLEDRFPVIVEHSE